MTSDFLGFHKKNRDHERRYDFCKCHYPTRRGFSQDLSWTAPDKILEEFDSFRYTLAMSSVSVISAYPRCGVIQFVSGKMMPLNLFLASYREGNGETANLEMPESRGIRPDSDSQGAGEGKKKRFEKSSSVLNETLESELKGLYAQAQQSFPGVGLSWQSYKGRIMELLTQHLGLLVDAEEGIDLEKAAHQFLRNLKWQELYLTTACAQGDNSAWDIFHSRYHRLIQKAAQHCAENATQGHEISDSLLTELFLPSGHGSSRENKIGQYRGAGSLEGWIRVVVTRLAIDQIRKQQKQVSVEDFDNPPSSMVNRELQAFPHEDLDRQNAVRWVSASLQSAFTKLTAQEKLILQLYYSRHATLKEIGKLLNAHESTASRTLERIHKQLRKAVERHLRENYRLRSSEIGHLIELAVTNLEIDLKW